MLGKVIMVMIALLSFGNAVGFFMGGAASYVFMPWFNSGVLAVMCLSLMPKK